MQLYHTTDEDFQNWIDDPSTNTAELVEAHAILTVKRRLLFTPEALDSYRHDRYERDARYASRMAQIEDRLRSVGYNMAWLAL